MSPYLAPFEERRERLISPSPGISSPAAKNRAGDGELSPRTAPREKLSPAAGLPKALLEEHGEYLQNIDSSLAALELAKKQLQPHQKKQLGLAEKKFFAVLGAQLTLAAPELRRAVAETSLRDFSSLVERSGNTESALPLIYAALGLFDSGARAQAKKLLRLSGPEMISAMGDAAAAAELLASKLYGRTGLPSALNVYSNLVERLELEQGALTSEKQRELRFTAANALRDRPGDFGAELSAPVVIAAGVNVPEFEVLDRTVRKNALAALGTERAPELIAGLVVLAERLGMDASQEALTSFAARWQEARREIAARPELAEEAVALAQVIGEHARDGVMPHLAELLDAAALIKRTVPNVSVAELCAPSDGSIGLISLVDPASDYRNSPLIFLSRLLETPNLSRELLRAAIPIAANVGRLGIDPGRYTDRIAADFAVAAAHPEKLRSAAAKKSLLDARVEQQPSSLLSFMRAHPQIPPELSATAGLHLSPEQLAWFSERVEKNARSLDFARMMRDFVFGAVDGGHVEVIEAARTSRSAPKAVQRALYEVSRAFKAGALGAVNFGVLAEGLKAGRDPIADLERAKDSGELAIDLVALTSNRVDPEGRKEILAAAARTNYLLGLYVAGGATADPDVDMALMGTVFRESLKSVANGTWPLGKYENAAGKKIMAGLSSDQGAVWREALVTSPAAVEDPSADPAVQDAIVLLSGIYAALPEAIELGGLGIPAIGWDQASIDNLSASRELLIGDLRAHPKGSDEHRGAQKKLAAVQENLSLLELYRALEETVGAGEQNTAKILLRVRPALNAALPVLARRGGEGFAEAADQILFSTQEIRTAPRQGRYAVDEDSFTALVTANTSGCLSTNWNGGAPGRQWGIAGALADANIRMLRVMEGDRQVYRGFMKFFPASFPGYQGPMLWLDPPKPDGDGTSDDLTLWYRHAIEKALAMGIPVATGRESIDMSWYQPARLEEVANSMGLAVQKDAVVRVYVEDGNTGVMHSDSLMNGKGNIRASRGENPTWNIDTQTWCVVLPKKVGA